MQNAASAVTSTGTDIAVENAVTQNENTAINNNEKITTQQANVDAVTDEELIEKCMKFG